jgi:EAL domain-containing protein (putative c-di-GMP-specific phosphodiesterase class I)
MLDIHIRDNWIKEIHTLSERSAVFTKSWLDKKSKVIIPLAQDAYIRTSLSNGDGAKNKQVKKAFHTFGYLNNIPNVYLFSKNSTDFVVKTASAKPLPLSDLEDMSGFFKSGSTKVSRIILDRSSQFLSAAAVYNSGGSPLGYVAYTENIATATKGLKAPLRNMLNKYNLSIFYQNTDGFVAIERINKIRSHPKLIVPGQISLPLFESGKKTGIFEDSFNEKVIASTIPIPRYPRWKIAVSRPTTEITNEATLIRNLIKGVALVTSILFLIIGTHDNHPVRDMIKLIFAPIRKKKKSTKNIPHSAGMSNIKFDMSIDTGKSKDHSFNEPSVLEKAAQKKLEKIPPSEAEIVYAIKTCIRNKQLKFMYQPVIDSVTQIPIMYEIYLRMFDEEGEMLQPALIFPAAEKNNLSSAIDECVVETAIERHLQNNRLATPLAINLTGATFESIHFLESLVKSISQKSIHGTKLIFELRSREIIRDKDAMTFIRNCHKLGCKFSIDYFGGGRNTIEAAKTLKFDYIKVDGLEFNPDTAPLKKMEELKEVADACLEHNIPLVMEKIETAELVTLCRRLRIPYIQGYKIAKPQNSL